MVGFHPCKYFLSSSNLLSCRTRYGVFPKQRHSAELTQKYRCWCHPVAPNLICGSCEGSCDFAWRCCGGTVVGACSWRNTVFGPCTPSRTAVVFQVTQELFDKYFDLLYTRKRPYRKTYTKYMTNPMRSRPCSQKRRCTAVCKRRATISSTPMVNPAERPMLLQSDFNFVTIDAL